MLKEKIKEVDEAKALKQSKWRNVIYSTEGVVCYGGYLHPSMTAAEKHLQETKRSVFSGAKKGWAESETGPTLITKKTYAWHMQVPVMD